MLPISIYLLSPFYACKGLLHIYVYLWEPTTRQTESLVTDRSVGGATTLLLAPIPGIIDLRVCTCMHNVNIHTLYVQYV